MFRVSLGLTSLFLSLVLAARSLDLLPDPDAAAIARRQAATEALALECALTATRNDTPANAGAFAKSLARRNPDVLSAAIRGPDGALIVETGDHDAHWAGHSPERSTPTHLHSTVSRENGDKLATVEVAYKPLPYAGLWRYVGGGMFPSLAFLWAAGAVLATVYLRLVFRKVGAGKGEVVPDRVRATLNTLAEGVLVLDKNGVIALANDAFARGAGTGADKLRGKKAADLPWLPVTANAGPADYPWAQAVRESAAQMGRELSLKTAADPRKLSVNSTPILGPDGECRGALATFDDLTDMERAKTEALAASKAKGEFLANVSHEIRTPMNAIIGMTELVLEGRLAAEQRECLDIARESATSLLAVINDLLDLSKIEAGRFDLHPVEFDPRDTLDEVLQAFALRSHKKNLDLTADIAADVPATLVGDPVRLRQILVNLVGNAVKFTAEGEVAVAVRVEATALGEAALKFTVSDTGIGVPQDKVKAIFEPFTQADGATTRQFGGTGLGLTISAHLVQLMGGTIGATSEVGVGSVFAFTARFGVPTATKSLPAKPFHGQAVIVIESRETTRRIVLDTLRTLGLDPLGFEKPEPALGELAKRSGRGEPCPFVMVDARLPGKDGFAVAGRIARERLAGNTIMLLPADDFQKDAERCRSVGAGYLRKPIRRADAVRALQRPGEQAEVSGRHLAPAVVAGPRLRVLVADDNDFNRKVSRMKLERWGHAATTVSGGAETLAALAENEFDLLLTDIQMPDMDGYELTAAIRQAEEGTGQRMPIFALTADAMVGVRERCLAAGMDGHIAKPIRDEELKATLEGITPSCTAEAETLIETPALSGDRLDEAAVLARVGGNREALGQLIDTFMSEVAELEVGLTAALHTGDTATAKAAAHTIKGMVAFFGFEQARRSAARMEDRPNADDASALVAALESARGELTRFQAKNAAMAGLVPVG